MTKITLSRSRGHALVRRSSVSHLISVLWTLKDAHDNRHRHSPVYFATLQSILDHAAALCRSRILSHAETVSKSREMS
jgi:hypothetical protein